MAHYNALALIQFRRSARLMNKHSQQHGDRNVIADAVEQSIIITGNHNQVTVAASNTRALPSQRIAELWCAYTAQLESKVSTVRIFGVQRPYPLDQVFVELSLNEDYERRPPQAEFMGLMDSELRRMRSVFGDAERLPDEDDPTLRHRTPTKRTINPDELLRRHTHAVITGAPGCGKTTLLRYLAWQTLKQWHNAFVVPPSGGRSGAAAPNQFASESHPPEGGTTNAPLPVFLELKQLTAITFQQAEGQLEDLLFTAAIAARIKP
ncbi:MAG: ATP-binding protein, partial [Acidobacteria bacterium]|nr:ATP-binding protein [Acidobacteriota bacterium]